MKATLPPSPHQPPPQPPHLSPRHHYYHHSHQNQHQNHKKSKIKSHCLDSLTGWSSFNGSLSSPGLYRGVLEVSGEPKDTWLDMRTWDKGVVFINGFNLGRFWYPGPTRSLYLPASLLQEGVNEVHHCSAMFYFILFLSTLFKFLCHTVLLVFPLPYLSLMLFQYFFLVLFRQAASVSSCSFMLCIFFCCSSLMLYQPLPLVTI